MREIVHISDFLETMALGVIITPLLLLALLSKLPKMLTSNFCWLESCHMKREVCAVPAPQHRLRSPLESGTLLWQRPARAGAGPDDAEHGSLGEEHPLAISLREAARAQRVRRITDLSFEAASIGRVQ